MGEELDKPEKIYSPLDADNKYLKFGLNQVQGWKKTMEDYAIHFLDKEENKFMNIFGIFDGHGGREVPKYLSSHFLEFLNKNKNFISEKYKDAFSETFFELDKSFTTKEAQEELTKYSEEYKPDKEREIKEINDLCAPNEKLNNEELEQVMAFNEVFDPRNIENANIAEFTGATGMIIAVCYRDILVAHAGNSRCLILDKDGKILNKTKDHTMKDENEKKRVDLARSFNDEEEEKKKGEDEHIEYLDSTRGFGDLEFKGNEWIEQKDQEISVEPDILLVPYDKDNKQAKYIIFGSHGMFEGEDDKVNEEIGKFFIDEINKNKENSEVKFSDIIKNYFEKIMAKEKNNEKNIGLDNMSCFLVELNLEEIKKYIEQKDEQIKEEKRKEEERKRKAKEEEMKRRAEERKRKEEERKRKEEDIVWAKIKGYPWWPGTIRHIFYYQSQNSYKGIYKRKKYIIDFIGNKSHGEVNKNDIKLFKPNYEEHCKTKNQALIKSIELANKLYQEKFNNNNIEIEEKKEDKETDKDIIESEKKIKKENSKNEKGYNLLNKKRRDTNDTKEEEKKEEQKNRRNNDIKINININVTNNNQRTVNINSFQNINKVNKVKKGKKKKRNDNKMKDDEEYILENEEEEESEENENEDIEESYFDKESLQNELMDIKINNHKSYNKNESLYIIFTILLPIDN